MIHTWSILNEKREAYMYNRFASLIYMYLENKNATIMYDTGESLSLEEWNTVPMKPRKQWTADYKCNILLRFSGLLAYI